MSWYIAYNAVIANASPSQKQLAKLQRKLVKKKFYNLPAILGPGIEGGSTGDIS
jgi:hypothetical protein